MLCVHPRLWHAVLPRERLFTSVLQFMWLWEEGLILAWGGVMDQRVLRRHSPLPCVTSASSLLAPFVKGVGLPA